VCDLERGTRPPQEAKLTQTRTHMCLVSLALSLSLSVSLSLSLFVSVSSLLAPYYRYLAPTAFV